MRTLYTLFALISLALMALVATAAPPNPQLVIDCGSNCLTGPVTLTASGVNTNKSYGVTGFLNGSLAADFADVMTAQADGTFTLDTNLPSGDWLFTLSVLGHTADPTNPQKDLVSISVTVN